MTDLPYYGELIAFCTTLSWSIGIFPFTEAARRLGPNPVNHFRLVLAVIMLTVVGIIAYSIRPADLFTLPTWEHWTWLGLSGIVGLTLGDYFSFTSFAILGTRQGSIFTTLSPGAALMFGFIIIGDGINVAGIIGMIITVGGVIWLILNRHSQSAPTDHTHGSLKKGYVFGILAAVCQGVGIVLSKMGMDAVTVEAPISPVHASWVRMITATGALYILTIASGRLRMMHRPVLRNENKGVIYAVMGTIFGPVVGVSFSLYAVSLINASVAQTIFSLVPVCVLLLGYIFYKEKLTVRSVLSALVAIAGVMILIWREQIQSWITSAFA